MRSLVPSTPSTNVSADPVMVLGGLSGDSRFLGGSGSEAFNLYLVIDCIRYI